MRSAQVLTQPQSSDFLPQIESLLQRMSLTYLRDFTLDLVRVVLRKLGISFFHYIHDRLTHKTLFWM